MKIDYKKELESASKGMIMIHDPRLLIKLIVRMIVRKLGIVHAAFLLHEPDQESYVLSISRGDKGIKVPAGFTRFDQTSPIIKLFTQKKYKHIMLNRNAIVSDDINRLIWQESVIENGNGKDITDLLYKVNGQMELLEVSACVPAYYRRTLMAVLLLGEKKDKTPFEQEELDFFAALASDTAMAIRNAQLFKGLKEEAERNRKLFLDAITVLSATIEAKDEYTKGHTERVTKYAIAIAQQMNDSGACRFNEQFFENLYISGTLHDIGKIAVPEAILNSTARLSEEEFEIMKQHAGRGADIVEPLGLAQETLDGIRHHHERYDGAGYPDGLKEDTIPISAAILAVADTFDAMTSDRSYRKGLSKEVAISEIKSNIKTQFHPIPAKAMLEIYEKGLL